MRPLTVYQLMQLEVGANIAAGRHGQRDVLEVVCEREKVRAVAARHKAGEGLAELVRAEAPQPALVVRHADMHGKRVQPFRDAEGGQPRDLVGHATFGQEQLVIPDAARSGA